MGPGLAVPRTFSAHFPTEPTSFYRIIALPVCQRSFPRRTVLSLWFYHYFNSLAKPTVVCSTSRAPTFQKLAY